MSQNVLGRSTKLNRKYCELWTENFANSCGGSPDFTIFVNFNEHKTA